MSDRSVPLSASKVVVLVSLSLLTIAAGSIAGIAICLGMEIAFAGSEIMTSTVRQAGLVLSATVGLGVFVSGLNLVYRLGRSWRRNA